MKGIAGYANVRTNILEGSNIFGDITIYIGYYYILTIVLKKISSSNSNALQGPDICLMNCMMFLHKIFFGLNTIRNSGKEQVCQKLYL